MKKGARKIKNTNFRKIVIVAVVLIAIVLFAVIIFNSYASSKKYSHLKGELGTYSPSAISDQPEFIPGEIIVKFKEEVTIVSEEYSLPAPISYFAFENNYKDNFGSSTASAFGAPQFSKDNFGTFLNLDGVNDYVDIENIQFNSNPFTISGWFKTSADTSRVIDQLWHSGYKKGQGVGIYITKNNIVAYVKDANGKSITLTYQKKINDRMWHHVVFMRDSNYFYLYVDSVLRASASAKNMGDIDAESKARIGNALSSNLYFKGFIDDIKVWNSDLTSGEIKKEYENGKYAGGYVRTDKDSVNKILEKHQVKKYRNIDHKKYVQKAASYYLTGDLNIENLENKKVLLHTVDDTLSTVNELMADENVEYAQPNYIYYSNFVPNDARYTDQWAHKNTHAEKGWDITKGNSDIIIAVIDSGVDYNHEDLQNNALYDCADGNCALRGYDFVDLTESDFYYFSSKGYLINSAEDYIEEDNDPNDFEGHGTHVSGVAAGVGNNNIGITGVCQNCKIMPLRTSFAVMDGTTNKVITQSLDADNVNAIYYAVDNGAHIITISQSIKEYSENMKDAIDYAYEHGVIVVTSAGNENSDEILYPAAYDHVLAVASIDNDNSKSSTSNYGNWIDVAAPGGEPGILSTMPQNNYESATGTSMAAPYVSGLAGLLLSKNKNLNVDEITALIKENVFAPTTNEGSIGTGIVDIEKALNAKNPSLLINKESQDVNGYLIVKVVKREGNDYCGLTDMDRDGKVSENDLRKFISEFTSDCRNVAPLDVLNIINEINRRDNSDDPYDDNIVCNLQNVLCDVMDVNGDGYLTALDALVLINKINYCESLENPHSQSNADVTEDGYVNYQDRQILVSALQSYPIGTAACSSTLSDIKIITQKQTTIPVSGYINIRSGKDSQGTNIFEGVDNLQLSYSAGYEIYSTFESGSVKIENLLSFPL